MKSNIKKHFNSIEKNIVKIKKDLSDIKEELKDSKKMHLAMLKILEHQKKTKEKRIGKWGEIFRKTCNKIY